VRRALLAVPALAVVAIAGIALAVTGRGGGSPAPGVSTPDAPVIPGGPLDYPQETHTRGLFPVELGRPYSWGEVLLRNDGELAVTVDAVELIRPSPGLVVLGVRAVRPSDAGGLIGFLPGWRREGVPTAGLVLRPGADGDVELVVGVRIDRPGAYGIAGVRVRYHDALNRYAVTFDQRLGVCGPAARYRTEARCRGG
jgi:hypothetical protein